MLAFFSGYVFKNWQFCGHAKAWILVLNDWLPSFHPNRPVKSTLLDILLLRASGWKAEEDSVEQETGSEFTEGGVFIEEDMTEEQQPEGTEENDEDEGLYAQ